MASTTATSTSQNPSLRLRLRRATPADVPDIVRIHFDAFGPCIMNRLMRPDGGSESARASFGRSFRFSPEDGPPGAAGKQTDPPSPAAVEQFTIVAEAVSAAGEEDVAPEVVAFAKWKLVREPLSEEGTKRGWDAQREGWTAEELGEGTNVEVYAAYIGGLHQLRAQWVGGDPCLREFFALLFPTSSLLHPQHSPQSDATHPLLLLVVPSHSVLPDLGILACSPTHQGLGAGSALLAWGRELADKEGLTTWLEASPQGYPLYRRFGYEDVDVQDLAVTERWGPVREEEEGEAREDWGQNAGVALAGELPRGSFRTVVMRRLPRVPRETLE